LPDISELNGTAIDNVREFDGLTVTAIAPPAAAYSVRLLNNAVGISSYTGPAMRVRRVTGAGNTGNDDEADVAFDTSLATPTISLDSAVSNFSGTSNATNLGQFLNATGYTDADSLTVVADGFCDEWKDQSGNGNHASQATPASQPQIFDSASPTDLITDNGKPALDFDGTNDGLNCSTNLRASTGASTVIQVRNVPKVSLELQSPFIFYKVQRHIIDQIGASNYNEVSISTNETANEYLQYTLADLSGQLLHFATWDGSTQTGGVDEVALYEDGAQLTGAVGSASLGVSASGTNSIGFRNDLNSQYCDGTFQEVIVWLSDQDSAGNRTSIETNISRTC
jgi:hypothetical protein